MSDMTICVYMRSAVGHCCSGPSGVVAQSTLLKKSTWAVLGRRSVQLCASLRRACGTERMVGGCVHVGRWRRGVASEDDKAGIPSEISNARSESSRILPLVLQELYPAKSSTPHNPRSDSAMGFL